MTKPEAVKKVDVIKEEANFGSTKADALRHCAYLQDLAERASRTSKTHTETLEGCAALLKRARNDPDLSRNDLWAIYREVGKVFNAAMQE